MTATKSTEKKKPAGRPPGALNRRTMSLLRAIEDTNGEDLLDSLASVADDDELPFRMRLDACKILAGALHGRVRINAAAKRKLNIKFKQKETVS